MSVSRRISSHLASHVDRRTAFVTFVSGAGVLLAALLIGACLLVALVFFYGFVTDAFYSRVSPQAIAYLKHAGLALAVTGGLSFAVFILGSCMLVGAINQARYRSAYFWFAALMVLLVAAFLLRVSTY